MGHETGWLAWDKGVGVHGSFAYYRLCMFCDMIMQGATS